MMKIVRGDSIGVGLPDRLQLPSSPRHTRGTYRTPNQIQLQRDSHGPPLPSPRDLPHRCRLHGPICGLGILPSSLPSLIGSHLAATGPLNAWNNLGQAYRSDDDHAAAAAAFASALELSPSDASSLVNLHVAKRTLCDWNG